MSPAPGARVPGSYSPTRRTALVLCGTGAHGAYHAGVLRAVQEAGVRVDLVAGQGVGAAGAALAAIDGAARLWEPDGIWRSPAARRFYAWKRVLRIAGWCAALLAIIALVPVLVLAAGLVVYPVAFLVTLVGLDTGAAVSVWFSTVLQGLFAPAVLPTIVPRLTLVALVAVGLVLAAGAVIERRRDPVRRRIEGRWWWQILAAPLDTSSIRSVVRDVVWQLIRGAALPSPPTAQTVGRRYAEALGESIGQPGFKELILTVTDLDARRDLVLALVREPYRREFLAPHANRDRRAEVVDLSAGGGDLLMDVVAGALTPPVACDPAPVLFPVDSIWRGETHRLCDRPGACHRLLDEVWAAGVRQVVIASAVAPIHQAHQLSAPGLDVRHRLGAFLAADECAALRDVLEIAQERFDVVYAIRPAHNPVGAFDLTGAYDAASDRRQDLAELIERGYEDACRQFIEPIVGASGEQLARPSLDPLRIEFAPDRG